MEGENGFKVYLASSTDFFLEFFFFFYGLAGFCTAWLEGTLSSCPKFFPLFPGVSATVSIYPVSPTAVLKPGSASSPGAVASDHTSSHGDLCPPKLHSLFLFPPTKRVHPASFFFLHPVRRFILATIRTSVPLLYPPGWGYGVQIAWPTFFTSFNRGAEKLTYIPYSSFQRSIFEAC